MKPDIGSESQFLPTPPALDPPLGGFPSEYRHAIWYGKTRMAWLPDGEKILMISFCFDTIHKRDGQTDAHTDRHTDTIPSLMSFRRELKSTLFNISFSGSDM